MAVVEIDWKPDRRKLRSFAVVWMVGFALVGAVVAFTVGREPATWLWLAAGAVGIPGALFPAVARPVYLVWMGLAFPVGWVMTHVVLLAVYFGVFTPLALAFRLVGRDALGRRPGPRTGTYWSEYERRPESHDYFRQF